MSSPSLALPRAQYFHARRRGQDIETAGQATYVEGYKVASDSGVDNGVFAEWSWDGETLHARVDSHGFFPLFYYPEPDGVAVSPSVVTLLDHGAKADLDYNAIASLFHLTTCLEDETPFRHIRALPPGGVLSWRKGTLQLSGGQTRRPNTTRVSRAAAIDAFIDLFRQAVARRIALNRPCIVPLSGGRDSRHILFELKRQGVTPRCAMTIAYEHGSEVPVAKQVAEALSVPHHVVLPPKDWLTAELRKNPLTHFSSLELAFVVPALETPGLPNTALWDGLAGDVLSAGHFLDEARLDCFRKGRFDELAELLTTMGAPRLFDPSIKHLVSRADVMHRLTRLLPRYAEFPHPVAALSLANRTRRGAALTPFSMFTNAQVVFAPYVDVDLFDFLFSLPAEMFVDHSFHTEAIHRAFPEFEHIPFRTYPKTEGWRWSQVREARRLFTKIPTFPDGLLNKPYAASRAARCILDPSYAPNVRWLSPLTLYLGQLSSYTAGSPQAQYLSKGQATS